MALDEGSVDTRGRTGDQRFEMRPGTPPPPRARVATARSDDAQLVDLTPVGQKPRTPLGGLWSVAVFGVILAALTGISLLPRDPSPSASNAPTQGALVVPASPDASLGSTAAATASPGLTSRPTSPPTPRPAPTPNLALWERVEMGFQTDMSASGIWAVGNQVLFLLRDNTIAGSTRWAIIQMDAELNWNAWDVPGAITSLSGGTVVDDELWFAARFELLGESWFELVSTTNGSDWKSRGRIEADTVAIAQVNSLARIDGHWVALVGEYLPADGGFMRERVLISRADGWRVVHTGIPDGASPGGRLARLGSQVVLVSGIYECCVGGFRTHAATSSDGLNWTVEDGALPGQIIEVNDLQCQASGCMIIASSSRGTNFRNELLLSDEGLAWRPVDLPLVDTDANREFAGLVPMDSGFLLTVYPSSHAWIFSEALGAVAVDVFPRNVSGRPYQVTVNGRGAFGVGTDQHEYLVFWHGDLDRMNGQLPGS
jgi:hypothetical protein